DWAPTPATLSTPSAFGVAFSKTELKTRISTTKTPQQVTSRDTNDLTPININPNRQGAIIRDKRISLYQQQSRIKRHTRTPYRQKADPHHHATSPSHNPFVPQTRWPRRSRRTGNSNERRWIIKEGWSGAPPCERRRPWHAYLLNRLGSSKFRNLTATRKSQNLNTAFSPQKTTYTNNQRWKPTPLHPPSRQALHSNQPNPRVPI
ncbi:unnamed protein product, partial [Ectocarpus sp. 12 AP-2014]